MRRLEGRYNRGVVVASIRSTAEINCWDSREGEGENRPILSPYRTWQLARESERMGYTNREIKKERKMCKKEDFDVDR